MVAHNGSSLRLAEMVCRLARSIGPIELAERFSRMALRSYQTVSTSLHGAKDIFSAPVISLQN